MKIKTSELTGAALDWAVAKCEFPTASDADIGVWVQPLPCDDPDDFRFQPSTNWALCGPIVERDGIALHRGQDGLWWARIPPENFNPQILVSAPTPLIAAMRCFVSSHLGDEVDIPNELTQGEASCQEQ